MPNVKVGRYEHESITAQWSGYIEGEANDGVGWIIWLDADGRPAQYYPQRDADGGVIGEPILMSS